MRDNISAGSIVPLKVHVMVSNNVADGTLGLADRYGIGVKGGPIAERESATGAANTGEERGVLLLGSLTAVFRRLFRADH